MRILVAEDNAANRELIREILELGGYEVALAEDGAQALQMASVVNPDLVLLDIQMPILNGYEVMERLRQHAHWRDLPIIALTAYAMRGDKERALNAGFTGYITKPIDCSRLLSDVAAVRIPVRANDDGGTAR